MMPEAGAYLDKAGECLDEAQKIYEIGLAAVAARSAYYAAFHAAEAFIIARSGKIAKSHSGVRSEFSRLSKTDPTISDFSSFLAQAYKYKEIGDYGVGTNTIITLSTANEAIETAQRFVACVTRLLG